MARNLRTIGSAPHQSPRTWLTQLTARLHAQVRQTSGERPRPLLAWARRYLPAHFRLPPSGMHRWLAAQLDASYDTRGLRLNVIGPRGGAKSTVGTLAFVLQAAVERREPYIWIISDTKHQAAAHLENLRTELSANTRLQRDYGGDAQPGNVWRSGALALNSGVMIEAFGAGQRIRGRRCGAYRPTLIVCDDLQNDGHIASPAQRESSRRWFNGTLLKAGTKRTTIVNLATALHRDAIALELHRTPGWHSRIFRAIEAWPTDVELWQAWETIYCNLDRPHHLAEARAFYDEHQTAMHAGAELLWPEEEDLYTLMCMRVSGGRTAFEREKQGAPIDPEACEWPEEYFGPWIWFDEWPKQLRLRTLALDPSKGQSSQRGDYSALVLLGIDDAGTLYLEADLARRPTPQIVADAVAHCRSFRPQAFGVEVNQFQELLCAEVTAEFARQNVTPIPTWTLDNRVNKQVRIRRLGPYLAARRLRFRAGSASTKLLVDQLRDFPLGDHDDGPDALEMALRLATELEGGMAR